jgi:D-xylose 1-dehydrogenase (NADP+, D-xylono-1,5-lactone-forming)
MSTAHINRLFLAGAREAAGVEVVAVASRDGKKAEGYAREHGLERAHGSYESLLADADVEVVYISLPNSLHLPWSVRALEAGKHVLCEKPLGRRAADVRAAFDVAEREGRLLMEGFMYRHNPQTLRLMELIASGSVGRVRLVRSAFSFSWSNAADIRLSTELGGGALMDVGCYCVNATRLIAGEPRRVQAEQVLGGDGVDVSFVATMRCQGEVVAQFDAGIAMAVRDELEVVGEEGTLFLDDPWRCREPVIEVRREQGVERLALEAHDSYRLEAENMSAAVRGDAVPLLGRTDAVAQASAIEALYQAASSGEAVVPEVTTAAPEQQEQP